MYDIRDNQSQHITHPGLLLSNEIVLRQALTIPFLRIPRDEVEEMDRVVMRELDTLLTGCTSTIVGG
jgi:hypothetical protein